jgi:S-adenosylmethionine decarboxylase
MNTEGRHLLFDVWLRNDLAEQHLLAMSRIIRAEFRVVEEIRHDFTPQGTTLVLILAESHFTIHTYPEERYMSMDLYVCGPAADLDRVRERIARELDVDHLQTRLLGRGARLAVSTRVPQADPLPRLS